MVTREELRGKLWPADTFVDFDHGLNAAIKRLRDALDDRGRASVLAKSGNSEMLAAIPSADGRFLAIPEARGSNNVWGC